MMKIEEDDEEESEEQLDGEEDVPEESNPPTTPQGPDAPEPPEPDLGAFVNCWFCGYETVYTGPLPCFRCGSTWWKQK